MPGHTLAMPAAVRVDFIRGQSRVTSDPSLAVCPGNQGNMREAWREQRSSRVCNHSNRKGRSHAASHSIVLHSHSHPALAQLTCSFIIFIFTFHTLFLFFLCIFTSQVKTKCNICGMNHEIDFGISSTDPSVKYQPIEELIAAYEELD